MAVLGYLAKLKKGLGLPFGAYFLHDFSVKMFLIYVSTNGQSFKVAPFFLSQDIKQNMLCSYNMKFENLRLITQKPLLK